MDEQAVISFPALYSSMLKCRCGVMWKDSVAVFRLNGIERCIQLNEELQSGTYKQRPQVKFTVTSPKPREIASVTFRDRVYQRSLNDNVVYPTMTKSFILDNYACQKGKGTDAARKRVKEFLRRYFVHHGADGFIAQFDISGYYPNMNHSVTEEAFREKLEPWSFGRVKDVLSQFDGEKGYNPGSQLVQIAGISVLDKFDHFVKEQLRAKYYLRYMDDFFIIHNDKEYLERCFSEIEKYLLDMGFSLNPKKSQIYPLKNGLPILGFVFYLTDTGKVIMKIRPENVKREKRKLRRMIAKAKRGELDPERVKDNYQAWRNHALKGNNYKLILFMDKYYKKLWEA